MLAALNSDALPRGVVQEMTRLMDRALLWLHEQQVVTPGRGLTVFRPAVTVHPEPKGGRFTLLNCGQGDAAQAVAAVEELVRLSRLDPGWSWRRTAIIAREWRRLRILAFDRAATKSTPQSPPAGALPVDPSPRQFARSPPSPVPEVLWSPRATPPISKVAGST
jgi:hypothetical protein